MRLINGHKNTVPASGGYTLASTATTSAGVFNGEVLVRTLWNGVSKSAGTYLTPTWDGKDDKGNTAASGNYQIKVVSNNVVYTWEGTIANNSTALTGPTKHRAYECFTGAAIAGTNIYITTGYNEGASASQKATTTNPRSRVQVMPTLYPGPQEAHAVCTDGILVYWGGVDPYSDNKIDTFVIATKVSDDTEKVFSAGAPYQPILGYQYDSAINRVNVANSRITGMAVQKTGTYLFVARGGLNNLYVINKTTGAIVGTLTHTSVRGISVSADDSSIWLITSGGTVTKHTINSGTLSAAVLTISGLVSPLFTSCSPDGSTVVISEGGANQRLKGYSTTDGSLLWTLGQIGGYISTAAVADDKFYFTDTTDDEVIGGWVAFQSDGSFWIGDNGNKRYQHFSAARAYIDSIYTYPALYNIAVDRNNPTRVFGDWLEYEIDYSKSLAPNNGSWKLKNNWGCNLPAQFRKQFAQMRYPTTLSNGRTYGFGYKIGDTVEDSWEVFELVNGSRIRFTGVGLDSAYRLAANGDIESEGNQGINGVDQQGFSYQPLTGFNGSGNPQWGTFTNRLVVQANADIWETTAGNGGAGKPYKVTDTNVLVLFQTDDSDNTYHVAGVKTNGSKTNAPVIWRSAKAWTASDGGDPYPTNGDYEIGNGVSGLGNLAHIFGGRNIVWGYNGEFWRGAGGQTNKWTHLWDNGLLIKTFGTVRYPGGSNDAVAEMAGNNFSSEVVLYNGVYYLYHNDESCHGGLHRWKITGLDTIQEQIMNITK